MSRQRNVLEAQLTVQQRKAAQLLVANEWGELLSEDGRKKSMQELAEEIGIARSTLYEWKAQEHFIDYVNYLTDINLRGMQSEVNVALMKAIRGGNNGLPSVKAIDLYMRRWALLSDRTIVEDRREDNASNRKTDEEIRRDIAELNDLVDGEPA
ncbi:putative insertion element HTH domain-containing protein [Paenibacillus pabuli]|uniref:Insertion element HTH domain-containing protein n=1 Tax=Paenibacillus pabuli TaxID=1472 RepID=A0ABX9BKA1_9BACL|nr:phBC6A51 family helix-turn-helix protein [Paenibacillus pabuli]RAI96859.1 putative insertion element HTH domain-containing protein [Paenibacillus pabuli]